LESQECSAHNKDNRQMAAAECAQTLALNSEIAKAITETESKDRKGNGNENDKLLCERDKELDPYGVDPQGRKMLVNPLRTADQVNRQDNNVSD
jgi:hypothetical protein